MLRIVIVEDEDIIRRGLVCTVGWLAMGCMVVGDAANGAAGFELIDRERPDIVITDIRMPKLDGFQMIMKAQQIPEFTFSTIFLTSYADFTYAQQAIRLQAADYLLKPVDDAELKKIMMKLSAKKEKIEKLHCQAVCPEFVDWSQYLQNEKGLNVYVRQALLRIRDNYKDKISIDSIAEELVISPSYLSRKFKETTSQTFGELLTKYRIQKAAQLLNEGTYRIYEVAEQTGFGDYKNFCMVFKKQLHISPKKFMTHTSEIVHSNNGEGAGINEKL